MDHSSDRLFLCADPRKVFCRYRSTRVAQRARRKPSLPDPTYSYQIQNTAYSGTALIPFIMPKFLPDTRMLYAGLYFSRYTDRLFDFT